MLGLDPEKQIRESYAKSLLSEISVVIAAFDEAGRESSKTPGCSFKLPNS